MTPVSLAQLTLRVLRKTNLEGASELFPPDEVTDAINVSLASWWNKLRATTFSGQIQRATWAITTAQGQTLYPLAPNHGAIISVDIILPGQSAPVPIRPYQEEERGIFTPFLVGWAPPFMWCRYQQQGNNINYLPLPTGGYNTRVNYFPTAPILSDPEDTLNSINSLEEWIVLKAGMKLLIKTGNVELIGILRAELADMDAELVSAIANQDMNGGEGVHEVEAMSAAYGGGLGGMFGW